MKAAPYIKTFLPVAVLLFFAVQRGNGFPLVILLLLFLLYLIYSAVRMVMRPAERKDRSVRLAVWVAALVLGGGIQGYWSLATRNAAELAVQKVAAYRKSTGTYPATLRDAGLDDTQLKDKWRLRYSLKDGKPALSYPASFMPLALYEYDFDSSSWKENIY